MPAPPQTDANKPVRYLGRRILGQPQVPVSDPVEPAMPIVPSGDANFSGGLLGRLAAVLAGMDSLDPTQAASSPPDDELGGFYRNDATQPWFIQRSR
jgi:hypothetical protein